MTALCLTTIICPFRAAVWTVVVNVVLLDLTIVRLHDSFPLAVATSFFPPLCSRIRTDSLAYRKAKVERAVRGLARRSRCWV